MTEHRRQSGFSLLEVTISLVVIGLLVGAGLGVWQPASERINALKAESFQQKVEQALINFVLTNYRLPCPDTTGNGYEGDCSTNGSDTGAVPYYSLGITLGSSVANSTAGYENMVYGVYRSPSGSAVDDADLAQLLERTKDADGDGSFQDLNDFRQALIKAVANPVTAAEIYITGDNSTTGTESCTINQVANVAFILISAGAQDRDGDNSGFDGVNTGWARNGNGTRCAASPLRRHDRDYDDYVVGVSFQSLLGYVTQAH